MRPSFLGLDIARSSLFAHQQYLDVTGHNIANANVEGYSRQRLNLNAGLDIYGMGYPGAVGTGVRVEQLERVRDTLLDRDFRRQQAELQHNQTRLDYLTRLENIYGDLGDTGLQASADRFFDAWQEAAQRPEDLSLRQVLLQRGQDLAEQVQQMDADALQLQQQAQRDLQQTVTRVNAMAEELAALNIEVSKRSGAGETPADLLDQRDRLLDELSQYARIQVRENDLGAVQVQIDGKAIVDEGGAQALHLRPDPDIVRAMAPPGNGTLSHGDLVINGVDMIGSSPDLVIGGPADYGRLVEQINLHSAQTGIRAELDPANQLVLTGLRDGSTYLNLQVSGNGLALSGLQGGSQTLTSHSRLVVGNSSIIDSPGGKLGGLQQARNNEIPQTMQQLNQLVNELASRVNQLHSNAYDLDGQTGRPFFTGSSPADLQVAQSLFSDPGQVALAANPAFPPGDGSQGLAIANLRQVMGFDTRQQAMITELGNRISGLEGKAAQGQRVLEQIENQRQSVAGVNLDEELSRMLQFQRAYNAAARVMTTFDEMLNQVINGMGLVGR